MHPITPNTVRPFLKALPQKPTGKLGKGKATIITEPPEKYRLLLKYMLVIFKRQHPGLRTEAYKTIFFKAI